MLFSIVNLHHIHYIIDIHLQCIIYIYILLYIIYIYILFFISSFRSLFRSSLCAPLKALPELCGGHGAVRAAAGRPGHGEGLAPLNLQQELFGEVPRSDTRSEKPFHRETFDLTYL